MVEEREILEPKMYKLSLEHFITVESQRLSKTSKAGQKDPGAS